jgi:hypothetical protein
VAYKGYRAHFTREKKAAAERIDRWIKVANLATGLPPVGEESVQDLQQVLQAWDRTLPHRHELQQDPLKPAGTLLLKVREPIKPPLGRPTRRAREAALDSVTKQHFSVREVRWPDSYEPIIPMVRAVRAVLEAFADAPQSGRPLHMGPDPHDDFREDLRATEIFRIRRCPVCANLFYANRTDTGACSPKCRLVNRVRTYRDRAREYEDNRKLKSNGVANPPIETQVRSSFDPAPLNPKLKGELK